MRYVTKLSMNALMHRTLPFWPLVPTTNQCAIPSNQGGKKQIISVPNYWLLLQPSHCFHSLSIAQPLLAPINTESKGGEVQDPALPLCTLNTPTKDPMTITRLFCLYPNANADQVQNDQGNLHSC